MSKARRAFWEAATYNPNRWYLYRSMGQTYLQNGLFQRDRMEPKNESGWEHQSMGSDGRWHTEEEAAKMAQDEARRKGWLR